MPTRREARTSVLPEGQNLGAGGIQFRRASKNRRGPPGRRAVLGRFPPRAMTTRLPMNSTSFKIRKVERRGGGNAYAPGGAYKRFARRAKPWRRRNSVPPSKEEQKGPPGRRAVLGHFPPRAMITRLPMNSTSFKIRKVKRRGAGGRKGHPCLCVRAEKDGARPQNTGVPVFAGGPERLGGGNS